MQKIRRIKTLGMLQEPPKGKQHKERRLDAADYIKEHGAGNRGSRAELKINPLREGAWNMRRYGDRERAIVRLYEGGMRGKEIAERIGTSPSIVSEVICCFADREVKPLPQAEDRRKIRTLSQDGTRYWDITDYVAGI